MDFDPFVSEADNVHDTDGELLTEGLSRTFVGVMLDDREGDSEVVGDKVTLSPLTDNSSDDVGVSEVEMEAV